MKKTILEFSERFGSMLSRVLLTVLYFGVLGPFAIVYRLVADPLHIRRRNRQRRLQTIIPSVSRIIENRIEPVVILMRDRIILMRVTFRAHHR